MEHLRVCRGFCPGEPLIAPDLEEWPAGLFCQVGLTGLDRAADRLLRYLQTLPPDDDPLDPSECDADPAPP